MSVLTLGVFLLLVPGPRPALAVQPRHFPDDSEPLVGHALVGRAGYIFSGTVKTVERVASRSRDSVAVMRITFQVEQAFRGVRAGQTLVIREWAGLWQGNERYRPGQRVMLFLYPPSKLGLTSPIGNGAGRFPIDADGNVVLAPRRNSGPDLNRSGRFFSGDRMPPRKLFRELRYEEDQ